MPISDPFDSPKPTKSSDSGSKAIIDPFGGKPEREATPITDVFVRGIEQAPVPKTSTGVGSAFLSGAGELVKGAGALTQPFTGDSLTRVGEAMVKKGKEASPVGGTVGQVASYAVPYGGALKGVQAAKGAMGMGKAATTAGRATEAAIAGGATGFGTTPGDIKERATAGVIGAVGSGVFEAGAAALGKQLQNLGDISQTRKTLADVAQKYNIQLTPGELTGNPMLRAADKLFSYMPLTAGAVKKIKDANDDQIASLVLEAMGTQGKEINQQALGLAKEALANRYTQVLQNTSMKLDKDFGNKIRQIGLTPDIIPALQGTKAQSIVDAYSGKVGERLTGADYNEIRSLIGEIASATGNDLQAARLYKIQRVFDDAAERTINKYQGSVDDLVKSRQEVVDNLKALRKQYTVFQDVFDAFRHKGMTPEGGLSLEKLYDAVNRRRPSSLHMDKPGRELLVTEELSRLQAIKGEPLPAGILAKTIPYALGFGGMYANLPAALATMGATKAGQKALYSEPVRGALTKGLSPQAQELSPSMLRQLGLSSFPIGQAVSGNEQKK